MKYQLMILRTKARTVGRNEINKVQKEINEHHQKYLVLLNYLV